MPKAKPKKRNPTDATLRNVRATAKRLKVLQYWIETHTDAIVELDNRIQKLEGRGKRR